MKKIIFATLLTVHELAIFLIRRNRQAQEFRSIGQTVDSHGQILLLHIDEACLVNIQHISLEEVLYDLVESCLIFMHTPGHLTDFRVNRLVQFSLVIFQRLRQSLPRRNIYILSLLEEFARRYLH